MQSDKDGNFTRVGTTGKNVVDYLIVNRKSYQLLSNFTDSSNFLESDNRALCFNISCNATKIYEQFKREVSSTSTNLEQMDFLSGMRTKVIT